MNDIVLLNLYVRCMFCNELKTLKDAALEGWEICNACQLLFCNDCKEKNKNEQICLGSVYTQNHKPLFSMLPIEQILEIGKDIDRKPKEGRFISKIFFDDEKKKIELTKKKEVPIEDFDIIRFREEQWRKFGSVLVKRKDGKFLTWGQID